MNVITLASRKGGSGKSTLTAHLAAFAQKLGKRCLILDADPQGSLTLWHSMRGDRQPPLENAARGIDRLLAHAMIDGVEWVFIDTAPTLWVVVQEAIRAATLVVIPVWSGQISQRAGHMASLAAGFSAGEVAPDSAAGQEVARLWSAVERSVAAIRGAQADGGGMHSRAA